MRWIPAALLLLTGLGPLTGCGGSLRLYSGEPRPLLSIARLCGSVERAEEGGAVVETTAEVLAVQGVSTVGFETVEVEPGPVALRVAAHETYDGVVTWRIEDELEFVAVAGGDYSVRALPSQHARPVAFGVWDVRFGRCVATTEPQLADVRRPELGLDAEWTLADWFAGTDTTSFTYLPRGQELDGWTRAVEAQFRELQNRPVRESELAARLHDMVTGRCADPEIRFVARGPDEVGAAWTGDSPATGAREWGVALLRRAAGGVDLFAHVDTENELDAEQVRAWLQRFRAARVAHESGAEEER